MSIFVSAGWFALIEKRVTVDDRPTYDPNLSNSVNFKTYFDWFDSTLGQERVDIAIAILGFVALIAVGYALRARFDDDSRASAGALAIAIGAMLWIVGNVFQLGGHRAVEKMSHGGTPVDIVNSVWFTTDVVDDWFELFAFAFIGFGVLALAWEGRRTRARRSWTLLSAVLGIVIVVLAGAYAVDNGDAVDLLLVLGGMILLPAWLLWTAESELRGARASVG